MKTESAKKVKTGAVIKYAAIFLVTCALIICSFAAGSGKKGPADGVIDLAALSGTMVFAQVANIMRSPEQYVGKIIKAKGFYDIGCYDAAAQCHHFVVILDASGCCPAGLEFKLANQNGKYPEAGTQIEISGPFKSYQKDGRGYYYIETDNIKTPGK
jgi:hypothetical protein